MLGHHQILLLSIAGSDYDDKEICLNDDSDVLIEFLNNIYFLGLLSIINLL